MAGLQRVLKHFYERFEAAFAAACRGARELTLTLSDPLEAIRIGFAITRSLKTGLPEVV
ncbi:hypothetical protein [Rhodoferax lacus]|uniref:hypothetical protein n=1 Tax=Rhodoferax lacus TaxID=2184758 RepID=UPI0018F4FFE8|nr:hypothetical protein [Rhodoferax lacus]